MPGPEIRSTKLMDGRIHPELRWCYQITLPGNAEGGPSPAAIVGDLVLRRMQRVGSREYDGCRRSTGRGPE